MKKNKISNIFFLLAFIALTGRIQAQKGYAWKSIGKKADNMYYNFRKGAVDNLFIQRRINGDLYVVTGSVNGGPIRVSKWNGTNWSMYPEVNVKYAKIRDVGFSNGQLYLSGEDFDSVPMAQRPGDLNFPMIKFNGNAWEGLSGAPAKDSSGWNQFRKGYIDNLVTWKGRLYYFSHSFVYTRNAKHRLYEIDAFGVHKLVKTYNDVTNDGTSIMLCVHNNKLVIAGALFNRIDKGIPVSGLETYDGLNFTLYEHSMMAGGAATLLNFNIPHASGLLSMNDSMLALVTNGVSGQIESKIILLKNGQFYKNLGNPSPSFGAYYINGMASFGNSLNVEFGWWDQNCYQYNLDSNKWVPWRKDRIFICTQGDSRIYGFRFDNSYNVPPNAKIIDFVELVKGSSISGKTFADFNSNCKFDTGEKDVKNALIEFDDGTHRFYAQSDDSGKYEAGILPGEYDVTCYSDGMIPITGSCSKQNILTKETDSSTKNFNLPVYFSSSRNLGVFIDAQMGFRMRHGFTEKYILTGTNYSFRKDSLILRLKYPPKSTFVSSSIQPFSRTNNEIIYKFNNVEWNDSRRIELQFSTSIQTSNLNDRMQFQAAVLNSGGDSLLENNTDTLRQIISGAFDPNIKQSSPEGRVKPGLTKIKYTIHFQNTGTDTAYKVTVVDTITQKLGLRYIKITSTSHPGSYSVKVVNNQVLVWEFNNILLPDSHANEKASHGYIAFEAPVSEKIAEGDSITNKAYIYFDYQKPVITNTAMVILDPNATIRSITRAATGELRLYPNPANTFVEVVADKAYDQKYIYLYSSLGHLAAREKLLDGNARFDIGMLSKGIYFLKIEGELTGEKLLIE